MKQAYMHFILAICCMALAGSGALAATTVWLSTDPSGAAIPGDTVTVTSGSNVTFYCFLSSDGVGNTFETMVGYDVSDATGYGAGLDTNNGAAKKLTLVSAKADVLGTLPAAYSVFSTSGYADKGVVLDASGREASNASLGGRPYGFVVRAAKTANELPGGASTAQVKCFSFTLKNNMSGTDSQYVVVSNLAGGNSYSTAWKHGTALYEDFYAVRVVNGSSNLPTVGTTNKSVITTLMTTAVSKYNWVLWGKVSGKQTGSFIIDDGSGVPIKVLSSDNTVTDGKYVAVKGSINRGANPPEITATEVTKYN